MTLHIGPNLDLSIDFAGEASAILARRGRGKTYAASVLAEELHAAGQPFVVLDPVGVWWGLRSSADGTRPGLDVKIIGGANGDIPLDPAGGAQYATFVVDNPAAYVIDLSDIESKGGHDRFVAEFADRLYKYKSAQERRLPLTLIIDEADEFAPQRILNRDGGYATRMLGAIEAIVRRGRARGLGCVLITQRPAVLNKNVLTQAGALVLLGMTGPQDRKAIDDWVSGHADEQERKEVMGSLAGLGVGEAWVWWPTENLLRQVKIRERRTFDSSSTPKSGQVRAEVRFADVDLDALKEAVADSIRRAEADDPKTLRARIADLERQLRAVPAAQPEVVEVDVISDEVLANLRAITERAEQAMAGLRDGLNEVASLGAIAQPRRPVAPIREATKARTLRAPEPRPAKTDGEISSYASVLLNALAERYPVPLTTRQWSVAADRSTTSSGWAPATRELRAAGLVTQSGSDWIVTDEGLEYAGVDPGTPPPSGEELVNWWCQRITGEGAGAARTALRILAADPEPMTIDEVADAAGWSRTSSGPAGAITVLVKLGLAERRDGFVYLDADLRA